MRSQRLTYNPRDFLLDGQPIRIYSGELHYFRIPRPYWRHRLMQARALGLNAVCTYMPWNLHEPLRGRFDFDGDGGMLDVAAFVRLAQELGLWVILRPGPYICAEWDFGGLPGWLLADPGCRIRCADPAYLEEVRRYIARVGEELAGLCSSSGGAIVMVQVENEYGSYADDTAYLATLRQMLRDGGFDDVLLFTSDGPQSDMLTAGTLEDCLVTANFGSRAPESLSALRAFRPNQPIMCGEFWCGWFDQWGKKRQGSADPAGAVADIRWMVENGASFNIYMLHGGTNFGFTAGANVYEAYSPTVTGYDYQALVDEAGRPTQKYHAVRAILADAQERGQPIPEIPPQPLPLVSIPAERFRLNESAALLENLPEPIRTAAIRPMEHFGQYRGGAILYRTRVAGLGGGKLTIVEPHDYAIITLDGEPIGTLDRRLGQTSVELPQLAAGAQGRLDILIWALGRVNYGPQMLDRKGITKRVELKHLTLMDWEVFPIPLDDADLSRLEYRAADATGPAFHRGSFELSSEQIGDTYLDLREWRIGCAWVNGHNLGRFWRIGPQQTLFCPGCWLKEGANEIVVLDLESTGRQRIEGLAEPILDELS